MPQVFRQYQDEPSTSDRFAQAFSNMGQAAGAEIPKYLMGKQQEKKQMAMNDFVKKEFNVDLGEVPEEFRAQVAEKLMGHKLEMDKLNKSHTNALDLQKNKYDLESQIPPKVEKPKETAFDKAVAGKRAQQYIDAETALLKTQDSLNDLDRIKTLSEDLRGPTGYAKALYGSKSAAELNALGTTVIDSVIKVFNPVGAIPVAKINLIRDKHSPKATDTQATIDGKVNALRRFIQASQDRSQKLVDLYDEHGGNPPKEALRKFHENSKKILLEIDKGTDAVPEETQGLSGKMIELIGPDGQSYEIDENELDQLPEGYRIK